MYEDGWVFSELGLVEACKVLDKFSLFCKMSSCNRLNSSSSSNVCCTERVEYGDIKFWIKYWDRLSAADISSSKFKHGIEKWLKDLFLELSDLVLENTRRSVLEARHLKGCFLARCTETHGFLGRASHFLHQGQKILD